MIRFACPKCQKSLEVSEDAVGRLVVCPTCGTELAIAGDETSNVPGADAEKPDDSVLDVLSVRDADSSNERTTARPKNQKYCVECGESIRSHAAICPKCGVAQNEAFDRPQKHCHDCGSLIQGKATVCPECGVEQGGIGDSARDANDVSTNRIAAGVCGILLGALGIHKFILGYTSSGIIMLLVSILGFCFYGWLVMHVIGIIEGITYLTMTDKDFKRVHGALGRPWF